MTRKKARRCTICDKLRIPKFTALVRDGGVGRRRRIYACSINCKKCWDRFDHQ